MTVNGEPQWTSKEAAIAYIKLRDKCFGIFCLTLRGATSIVTHDIVRVSNLIPASQLLCTRIHALRLCAVQSQGFKASF
jgi:hypothetical protein